MRFSLSRVTALLLIVATALPAQADNFLDKIKQNLGISGEALTTSIKDATGEVPYLDNFSPRIRKSFSTLAKDDEGKFLIKPGAYVGTFQSFCLHAGTYGPTRGNGYVTAPLKGPKAYVIKRVLKQASRYPNIPQSQVQTLIWTIEAGVGYEEMSPPMRKTLSTLLWGKDGIPSAKEMRDVWELAGGFGQFVPADKVNDVLRQIDELQQPLFKARNIIRRINAQQIPFENLNFSALESAAVLQGEPPAYKEDRFVPDSRWVYSKSGLFLRFNPSGYSRTEIEAYCPEPFVIRSDKVGRIREIETADHEFTLRTNYVEGIPAARHQATEIVLIRRGQVVFQSAIGALLPAGVPTNMTSRAIQDVLRPDVTAHSKDLQNLQREFIGNKPRALTGLMINLTNYKDGLTSALEIIPDEDARNFLNNFVTRAWMATAYQWINEDTAGVRIGQNFLRKDLAGQAGFRAVAFPAAIPLLVPVVDTAVGVILRIGAAVIGLEIGSTVICPGETGRQRLGICELPLPDGTVLNSEENEQSAWPPIPRPDPTTGGATADPGGIDPDPDNEKSPEEKLEAKVKEILDRVKAGDPNGQQNFGVGEGTATEANAAGREWVGEDARLASDGKTLVSKDGTRQYRPPSWKKGNPNNPFNQNGKSQANFESRPTNSGPWKTNGHLDIR